MNDIDDRIRDALRAAAGEIREQDLRPAPPPHSSTIARDRRTIRWLAPTLAAAAVAAVVATSAALSGSPNDAHHVRPGGHSAPVNRPTSSASGSTSPSPASTTVQASRAPASPVPACFFADACPTGRESFYEPLWPFADYAQARQWERVDGPNGHSPWHLDAKATALFFTQGYLGFADVKIVTSARIGADQAHIGVGFRDPNGARHTSAVLHLVRYERTLGDPKAGWEVVGSDDTTFSIRQPGYGSTVSSPMTVGGRITGVDENVLVAVRSFDRVVGRSTPLPAGGTDAPWSVRVKFTGGGTLTVVASTGGHLVQHERFAVQGVHTAP
jgi:hypothetical protein